jgi:hypothetical protein
LGLILAALLLRVPFNCKNRLALASQARALAADYRLVKTMFAVRLLISYTPDGRVSLPPFEFAMPDNPARVS